MNTTEVVIEELESALEACVIVLDEATERAEDEIRRYEYQYAATSTEDDKVAALADWLERAEKARKEANKLL